VILTSPWVFIIFTDANEERETKYYELDVVSDYLTNISTIEFHSVTLLNG